MKKYWIHDQYGSFMSARFSSKTEAIEYCKQQKYNCVVSEEHLTPSWKTGEPVPCFKTVYQNFPEPILAF